MKERSRFATKLTKHGQLTEAPAQASVPRGRQFAGLDGLHTDVDVMRVQQLVRDGDAALDRRHSVSAASGEVDEPFTVVHDH